MEEIYTGFFFEEIHKRRRKYQFFQGIYNAAFAFLIIFTNLYRKMEKYTQHNEMVRIPTNLE